MIMINANIIFVEKGLEMETVHRYYRKEGRLETAGCRNGRLKCPCTIFISLLAIFFLSSHFLIVNSTMKFLVDLNK